MAIADDREQCFQLNGVSWEQYESFLKTFASQRLRHSYFNGVLEFMSPSTDHDWMKRRIGRMIETATVALGIEIFSFGSSTLKRSDAAAGLEPDECYFITNVQSMRDREDFDPDRDPPPDLAVEIDVSRSFLPRLPIYSALGVLEIWRYKNRKLTFVARQPNGEYAPIAKSLAFPILRPEDVMGFLDRYRAGRENAWLAEFSDWLRTRAKNQ